MLSDTGSFDNPGRWQGYFEHTEMVIMAKAGTTHPGKRADLVVPIANPLTEALNAQKIELIWIASRRLNRAK